MLVSSKVQPVLVSIDADWAKVVDFTADGNYLISVAQNTRTASRTASISIKAPGAIKSVTLTQEGVPATGASVTEIIAAADNDQVQTLPSTVVVALTTRGAVLSDGENAIYAYGNSAAALTIGDGVRMSAKKTTYNGVPELTDITDIFVDSQGNAVSYPTATDITANVENYTASVAEYIKFSGTLTVSGNYYNIAFDGVDPNVKQGSITYPVDALDAKSWDGKKITVTGFFNGLSHRSFLNIGSSFLAATTTGTGSFLLATFGGIGLVVVNKFDDAHLSIVTFAETGLQDAGVTAGAGGHLLGNLAEKFRDGILVLKFGENHTSGMGGIVLAAGYQRFDEFSQLLGLGQRGGNAFMHDQGCSHIGHERLSMGIRSS